MNGAGLPAWRGCWAACVRIGSASAMSDTCRTFFGSPKTGWMRNGCNNYIYIYLFILYIYNYIYIYVFTLYVYIYIHTIHTESGLIIKIVVMRSAHCKTNNAMWLLRRSNTVRPWSRQRKKRSEKGGSHQQKCWFHIFPWWFHQAKWWFFMISNVI